MKPNIFREYDIRGIVGSEFIIDQSYQLGQAIGTFWQQKHPESTRAIVGMDGRTHSAPIKELIVQGLVDMGFDVIDVGVCPTPAVYFAVNQLHIPTAMIITASHNPKEYNGIKPWGCWGAQIQAIRKLYEETTSPKMAARKGSINYYNIIDEYVDYLAQHFKHLHNAPIKAIIDCGNGSAGTVMPALLKKMGWDQVQLLFAQVDGTFPNHEADPTVPENMTHVAQALAQDPTLEIGLGLDGDCDRMNPMTRGGYLVPGDKMLALFAKKVLTQHPGAAVVCDIKSSAGLLDALTSWGGKACIAPSGHAYIKKAMAEHEGILGGELSCHFFFRDRYFGYDDGIYAILRTIELLQESRQSLDQLLTQVPHKVSSPEFRIPCKDDTQKFLIVNHLVQILSARPHKEIITIDGIRAHMDYGWGLIRASNTQPVLCLRFESDTDEGLRQIKQDFLTPLITYFNEQYLRDVIGL